jgi:hypothetical protein
VTNVVHLPVIQPAPEALTREQRRSRRSRDVRAVTISTKRMTKRDLQFGKLIADMQLEELGKIDRPRTRADCEGSARPCPFISCKHHLYLDVSGRTGAIKLNFPDVEPDALEKMPATCLLDTAARENTLEEVAVIMNLTRERVRQVEMKGLTKLRRESDRDAAFGEYADDLPDTGRVTDDDVERLEKYESERTPAMPNHGYSDKVWNVLSGGRRMSVEQLAKEADVPYRVARQTIQNFHQSGKVRIFNADGGGVDVELVEGAERVKSRSPIQPSNVATEQKTAPLVVAPPRPVAHIPKVKDLSHAPAGSPARFTLRYFEAHIDCASAQDVAELLSALKRVAS